MTTVRRPPAAARLARRRQAEQRDRSARPETLVGGRAVFGFTVGMMVLLLLAGLLARG